MRPELRRHHPDRLALPGPTSAEPHHATGLPTDLTGLRLRNSPGLDDRLEALAVLATRLWALQMARYPAATRDLSVAFSLLGAGAGLRVPL